MMNKLVLLLSLSLPVSANSATPLGGITGNFPCFDFLEIKEQLKESHNEIPFMSGQGASNLLNMVDGEFQIAQHDWYLFANPETYEYTLMFKMDVGENGAGCIVSTGKNLGPVIQDEGI